jgi:hypothetical protein
VHNRSPLECFATPAKWMVTWSSSASPH